MSEPPDISAIGLARNATTTSYGIGPTGALLSDGELRTICWQTGSRVSARGAEPTRKG